MSEALLVIVGAGIGLLGTLGGTVLNHSLRRRDEVAERVRVALLPISEAHATWATAVWSYVLIEDTPANRERVSSLTLNLIRLLGALGDASADPEIGARTREAAGAVQSAGRQVVSDADSDTVESALNRANAVAALAQRAARRRAYPRTLGERWRGWRVDRADRKRNARGHGVRRPEGKS